MLTTTGPNTYKLTSPEWYYQKLELVLQEVDQKPSIDITAWKALVTKALTTFQGIMGQAIMFDVLDSDEQTQTAIVRFPTADKDNFVSCIVASVMNIDPGMVGLDVRRYSKTVPASLRIVAGSQYLVGVTAPDRMGWYKVVE